MRKKLTRWLGRRRTPDAGHFDALQHPFLCLACNEVSEGRQLKCVRAHPFKVVPLDHYLVLQRTRIENLFRQVRACRGLILAEKKAPLGSKVGTLFSAGNDALHLTWLERQK